MNSVWYLDDEGLNSYCGGNRNRGEQILKIIIDVMQEWIITRL
jgi:hypothetical protein